MSRESVASGVNVDGGAKGLDVHSFLYASPDPILLMVQDSDILAPEVVALFTVMLKHGRFVSALGVCGCGRVLCKASVSRPLRFANICALAWGGVYACAWDVIDCANLLLPVKLVLALNEGLSQGSPGFDGGAESLRVKKSYEGFSYAGKEWDTE